MLDLNPWHIMTLVGNPLVWVVISIILASSYLIIRRKSPRNPHRRLLKLFILLLIPSLVITFGLASIIKHVLLVPRSCMSCMGAYPCNPYCPPDPSFPSAHVGTAFAAFTSLFLVARDRKVLILFVIPLLVAMSRLMLGVHTVPDLIGGAVLGIAITYMVWETELIK